MTEKEFIEELTKKLKLTNTDDLYTKMLSKIDSLIRNRFFLTCLEYAGVDNWDGYEYACEDYNKEYPEE